MGRKVHPIGFRLKINKTWDGRWYAEGDNYVQQLHQDFEIRDLIREDAPRAGVSRIEIERFPGKVKIIVHTAKPGVLIGRKGENVKRLRAKLEGLVGKKIDLEIKEISSPDLDALLVAQNIAGQLERRISFSRAMKRSIQQAMRQGAEGVRVQVSGRLNGAEMARTESYKDGRIPLHTLRADNDYGFAESLTTFGLIGVKVWIYNGVVLSNVVESEEDKYAVKRKTR